MGGLGVPKKGNLKISLGEVQVFGLLKVFSLGVPIRFLFHRLGFPFPALGFGGLPNFPIWWGKPSLRSWESGIKEEGGPGIFSLISPCWGGPFPLFGLEGGGPPSFGVWAQFFWLGIGPNFKFSGHCVSSGGLKPENYSPKNFSFNSPDIFLFGGTLFVWGGGVNPPFCELGGQNFGREGENR